MMYLKTISCGGCCRGRPPNVNSCREGPNTLNGIDSGKSFPANTLPGYATEKPVARSWVIHTCAGKTSSNPGRYNHIVIFNWVKTYTSDRKAMFLLIRSRDTYSHKSMINNYFRKK
jgi:hypothetical protein